MLVALPACFHSNYAGKRELWQWQHHAVRADWHATGTNSGGNLESYMIRV